MKKKSLLLIAVATLGLIVASMAQTVPSYVPASGLVGWWPFNGNANDESGNNNNGAVNGATLTSDRFGNINKAYSFDGINDYVQIANNTSLEPNSSISISAWVFIDSTQTTNFPPIISKEAGIPTGYTSYALIGGNAGLNQLGDIGLQITTNNGGYSWTGVTGTSFLNQWVFVTGVYDGSNMKIYHNGGLTSSTPKSGNIQYQNYLLTIARSMANSTSTYSFFKGNIDDIGIWNRALTQQEITDLYNGCQLSVSAQPTNQTININTNAQFVVSSSDPSATYQWQTDLGVGFQNLNSVGQYSGTTNDTLIVSNVTMSNNNQPFRCIISSGSCTDTSDVAVLTVNNNVGINETSQDKLFSVFPNPAQSVINVKADSKLIGEVYTIYDNTGRIVLSGKLNAESTTIELGNLSGGIYMFSVGENMKQTFKVIKE